MDYILAFSVMLVILGVLISMLSRTSGNRVGGEVPAPNALVLTRIKLTEQLMGNELEAIAQDKVAYKEEVLYTDLDCFPLTIGKKERKANPKKGIVSLPNCKAEDGVTKRHILLDREIDKENGTVHYTIENISKDNAVFYYCNDTIIPDERKHGRLFNNISNAQMNRNRNHLVFYDKITIKIGSVILRLYNSQYYRKMQFQTFVEEQEGELDGVKSNGMHETLSIEKKEKKQDNDKKYCPPERKGYDSLVVEGESDVGKRRQQNEDALLILPEQHFFCVCDGMGGMERGQESSAIAVDMAQNLLSSQTIQNVQVKMEQTSNQLEAYKNALFYMIQYISNYLYTHGEEQKTNAYMYGTTFSGVWIQGNKAIIGNLGDSRTYIWRENKQVFQQVTKDHSYVQFMVDCGRWTEEEARRSSRKNEIMQFMGMHPDEIMPDIFVEDIQAGDRLLLCTDGLTNMVSDEEIQKIICDKKMDCKRKCKELIRRANRNGGKDNITTVLIEVQ